MDKVILEAKGLVKSFKNGTGKLIVLNGVDINLKVGNIVTIMGKSGSGKSTLLNILSTLDIPDQGAISINGKNVKHFSDDNISYIRNSYIGFVFQFHHLLPDFTIIENILMPVWIRKKNDRAGLALEFLDTLGLIEFKDKYPLELSGGERQRVAVIRALMNNPKILFADEPTGNLDRESADTVSSLLFDLHRQRQAILVVVTHNVVLAQRCARQYQLNDRTLEPVSL